MAVNRNTDTLSGGAPERTISRDVLVSSAQLLSMFATPVEIVPTPGANFGLVFEGAQLHKLLARSRSVLRHASARASGAGNCAGRAAGAKPSQPIKPPGVSEAGRARI